jgi:hypothetical protein
MLGTSAAAVSQPWRHFFELSVMTSNQREIDRYRSGNVECAQLVLADPEKYPGLMLEWARAVMSRPAPPPRDILFEMENPK